MKSSDSEDAIPLISDATSGSDERSSSFDFDRSKEFSTNRPFAIWVKFRSMVCLARQNIQPWITVKVMALVASFLVLLLGTYLLITRDWSDPGTLRPSIHFSAPTGTWLNDPNGLYFDANGTYHMYYQHLWTYEAKDCKNWGHATSRDLYSWVVHPLAIECRNTTSHHHAKPEWGIWSGSIVIDKEHTSGLFDEAQDDGVVALYTEHHVKGNGVEWQSLAYSADNGFTFEAVKKNPVLAHASQSYDFRDPKVFWHQETRKWVMVVALAAMQRVEIYTSMDLRSWKYESAFTNPSLTDEHQSFECPNLVQMPLVDATGIEGVPAGAAIALPQSKFWMLTLSSGRGHPGRPGGGSVVRYFPGSFNGTHFTPIDTRTDRLLDHGPDFYATQFWHNAPFDAGPLSISWAANLADCDSVPSGDREHWRGMMTLPRTGMLLLTKDGDVRHLSAPVGLDLLRGKELLRAENITSSLMASTEYSSGALVVDVNIWLRRDFQTQHGTEDLHLRANPAVSLIFMSSVKSDTLACMIVFHKGGPQFGCYMADGSKGMSMSIPRFNDDHFQWELQLIIDRSILEVFLNRGIRTGTMTMWPEKPYKKLEVQVSSWMKELGIINISVQELRLP